MAAQNYLAYPDLGRDQFTGTDPDQDPEQFIQLIEKKFRFSHGDTPANGPALDDYNFRRKSYFATLLRGPAAEWFETSITDANTWAEIRERFITRFADGRNKFRHRMEAEHVIRRDGEEIKNFLHRIKIVVGKGWPDDLAGVAQNNRDAERAAQDRQRRQRCIDYSLRGLRPPKLREKAHEYLMDHPNATWEQFSQAVINKDLSYTVTTSLTGGESHADPLIQELREDIKGIKLQIKEQTNNTINAIEKTVDPNATGRRMATRFCSYCRTNGHTPNWCRKKMRDEEIKKVQNESNPERRITFTNDYNKRTGPGHGSRFQTRLPDSEIRKHMAMAHQLALAGAMQSNPARNQYDRPQRRNFNPERRPMNTRFSPGNQRFSQEGRRPFLNNSNNSRSVSPGPQRARSPFSFNRDQPNSFNRNIQPLPPRNNSVFNRPQNRNERPNTPTQTYEQRFPRTNDMGRHNTVQFLETDYSVNSVADIRPLNY